MADQARFKLAGRTVAFTGRLISMTRREAADLLNDRRAVYARTVSRNTTMLVVGREGWPLSKRGRLTRNLRRARRLQREGHSIQIIPEEAFLRLLEDRSEPESVCRRYTAVELSRILGVTRSQLRSWVGTGLVEPETNGHLAYFDYRQVSRARAINDLLRSGVKLDTIRRAIRQLRRWLPEAGAIADRLGELQQVNGHFVFRTEEGRLAETTGQLVFDFAPDDGPATVRLEPETREHDLFEMAVRQEESGQLKEAAETYCALLMREGPDADACFNLGNVLSALARTAAAVERYRQVVEIEPGYKEGWNNLGNALCDLEQYEPAVAAYRRAIACDPQYADAHFNLAQALEDLGRPEEARPHWRRYLRIEKTGEWADYARNRLREHPA